MTVLFISHHSKTQQDLINKHTYFVIFKVYTNESNQEMLLCLAFVFEVCPPEVCSTTGAMCKVFRLENTSSIQVPHHAIM